MAVEQTCLALLRECEGLFRRRVDGTDKGECPTIDFTCYVFSMLSRECTEEWGHVGKYRDRCGDP